MSGRSYGWLGVISPVGLLALWEILSGSGALDARFFPPPSEVFRALVAMTRSGELPQHIGISVRRILLGFAAGAVPAVGLGLAMGLARPVRALFMPIVSAIYPIPKIAIYPLIIVYLGVGEASKVSIVALSIFFLVLLNTMAGVLQLDRAYFNIARAYGAGAGRVFTTVALPGAMPQIFTGLKLGMGFALIVIVGAELLGSDAGIGHLIWRSYQIFAIDAMFVGLLVTAVLGWLATIGLDWLERAVLPWRPAGPDALAPIVRDPGRRPGWLALWWRAVRPFSFTASATAVVVGAAAALYDGAFHVGLFAVTLAASVAIHAGANLANDYYDHVHGVDAAQVVGPSGVIQEGLLRPRAVLYGALALFAAGGLLGSWLVAVRGWPILAIGVASVLAGYAYTGGPLPLGYIGLGDAVVFVFMGLLIVTGTYYVLTGAVSGTAVWAALPVAALVDAILVVNNLRDLDSDRRQGKRTLATYLGRAATRYHWLALVAGAYLAAAAAIVLGILPVTAALVAVTVPLAVRTWRVVRTEIDEHTLTNDGVRQTARLHLQMGMGLAAGLILSVWL